MKTLAIFLLFSSYCFSQSSGGNTNTGGTSAGVSSINSTGGAFTFTGSGVSCTGTTCTFSGASSSFSALTSGANTQTGAFSTTAPWTFSAAGAASTPGLSITGTPFAGTASNSLGQLNIQWGTAAGVASLSTAGTALSILAPTGSTSDLIHAYLGTSSVFLVTSGGSMVVAGVTTGGAVASSSVGANALSTSAGGGLTLSKSTAATSTVCQNSGSELLTGTYWTGAASATNTISLVPTCTGGTNGAEALTIANTVGSTGPFTLNAGNKASDLLTASAYGQTAASSIGGTCTMTTTSCTITIAHTYTTPVCITTPQTAAGLSTLGGWGCTVSGTTVTITAATSNTDTWGAFVFGNPN